MVPEGWSNGRVLDFFKLQRGYDLTKAQSVSGNVPVYSSSGVAYYHNAAKVQPPGIVTGRKGSVGPVYYIQEPFWPHDTSLWVSDFKENLPKYVWYFLQNMRLEQLDESSSVPTLNRNNVHRSKCIFPPLPEQRKIADILSTWDRAIETNEALLATARTQKRALMQSLLTGKRRFAEFEGQAWQEVRLGDLGTFKKGKGLPKTEVGPSGRFPCVLYGELYTKYGEVIATPSSRTDLDDGVVSEAGDVLIPASTTTSGIDLAIASCVLEDGVRLGGDINVFRRSNAEIGGIFLAYFLSHIRRHEMARFAQGATIVHLKGSDLLNIKISVPCQAEQAKIVDIVRDVEQQIDELVLQVDKLRTEKKALMQQLLTGKRRVKV